MDTCSAFVRQGPTYVGSLILRAPFAMVPVIWGGGKRAVYFASALPCMFALAALLHVARGAPPPTPTDPAGESDQSDFLVHL